MRYTSSFPHPGRPLRGRKTEPEMPGYGFMGYINLLAVMHAKRVHLSFLSDPKNPHSVRFASEQYDTPMHELRLRQTANSPILMGVYRKLKQEEPQTGQQ